MKRLRIGLVANCYDNEIGFQAGGNVHFWEVAKRWDDKADLVIFAPESARADFTKDVRAEFVAMPTLFNRSRPRMAVFLYRTIMAFARRAELRECDVVLATSHFFPDVIPALIGGRRRAAATVWHVQDYPWKRGGSLVTNTVAYISERGALFFARNFLAGFVVGSRFIAARVGLLRTGRPIAVTTNGVDHASDDVPDLPAQRRGAIYVGRLHPSKGIADLIRAWRKVADALPGEVLTLAGDGAPEYKAEMNALVQELGLQNSIVFAGRVSEREKWRMLRSAKMLAFASKEEGWGIAVAEAMSAGLPAALYDLPVFEEIFTRGCLKAPAGDTDAFARNVIALLADDPLRETLAREALELSETFSWDRAAEAEWEIVDLLARNGSAR